MGLHVDENGRVCFACMEYKTWEHFNKGLFCGHDNRCRACTAAYRKTDAYRSRNRFRQALRLAAPEEREKQNARVRAYHASPEMVAKRRTQEFKDSVNAYQQQRRVTVVLTPQQLARRREVGNRNMRKFLSNPRNRLSNRMAAGVKRLLRGQKNGRPWETLVGYTIDDLRSHLEKLFEPGMTWENYGKNGWHVDHIRPMTAFVFVSYKDPEFRLCWSLDNLMPRWCTTAIAIAHGSRSVGNINKGNSFKFYRQ